MKIQIKARYALPILKIEGPRESVVMASQNMEQTSKILEMQGKT